MKRAICLVISICFLGLSEVFSAFVQAPSVGYPPDSIPQQFLSSSRTSVLEWGCPVSEKVDADSSQEALRRIGRECLEEAKRAATIKPGVFEVISASIIWPDVAVSEEGRAFRLHGTFFVETLVLESGEAFR